MTAVRSLWVDRPAQPGDVVTTPELIVRGRVSTGVDAIWIFLESSGGKPVASRSIDSMGMPRDGKLSFESRFDLSMPRPTGSLALLVVAVGPEGVPIDAVRRRFQLGAIVEPGTRSGR